MQLDGMFLDDVERSEELNKQERHVERCNLVRHVEHKELVLRELRQQMLYVVLVLGKVCMFCKQDPARARQKS